MLISTALLLDSIIRNSVYTPAKLPCRRVEVGYEKPNIRSLYNLKQENSFEFKKHKFKKNVLMLLRFY
jgi:hypothetical protein